MEPGDAADWLLHAESDLRYAKLGQGQPVILRNHVAFHAEQAAEKALKAVLVHAAVEFTRTHDLQGLLLLIRNSGIRVRPEIQEANALTRFAVEARYPGDTEPITPEEVAQAMSRLRELSPGHRSRYANPQNPDPKSGNKSLIPVQSVPP